MQRREVRREADRALAGPHRRRAGQPRAVARRCFMQIGGVQRQRHEHPGRHLVVGRQRHDLPGRRLADDGLQQPHGPLRQGPDERRTPTRWPAARASSTASETTSNRLSRHQHELRGQAEARRLDRSASLRRGHGRDHGGMCTHDTADEARPDELRRAIGRRRHSARTSRRSRPS